MIIVPSIVKKPQALVVPPAMKQRFLQPSAYLPWDIITTKRQQSTYVNIWPGTVNGIMPENMYEEFQISDESTNLIKLTIDSDGSSITSVTINVDSSQPDYQLATENALPSGFDILVGIIKNGFSSNLARKNIQMTPTAAFNSGYWAIS